MSRFRVEVSRFVDHKVAELYDIERSSAGEPSIYDFESGPLAAALLAFGGFDRLVPAAGPSVRTVTIVDPFFGAVVFTGVLTSTDTVEIADFGVDDTYWDFVDRDPVD